MLGDTLRKAKRAITKRKLTVKAEILSDNQPSNVTLDMHDEIAWYTAGTDPYALSELFGDSWFRRLRGGFNEGVNPLLHLNQLRGIIKLGYISVSDHNNNIA